MAIVAVSASLTMFERRHERTQQLFTVRWAKLFSELGRRARGRHPPIHMDLDLQNFWNSLWSGIGDPQASCEKCGSKSRADCIKACSRLRLRCRPGRLGLINVLHRITLYCFHLFTLSSFIPVAHFYILFSLNGRSCTCICIVFESHFTHIFIYLLRGFKIYLSAVLDFFYLHSSEIFKSKLEDHALRCALALDLTMLEILETSVCHCYSDI